MKSHLKLTARSSGGDPGVRVVGRLRDEDCLTAQPGSVQLGCVALTSLLFNLPERQFLLLEAGTITRMSFMGKLCELEKQ